jgi:phage terminase small subunit
VTERAQRLLALAGELGLTEKQRLFAEALVADPEQNQTKAAGAAGYKGTMNALGVQAHANLKNPKIQQYIAAISAETGLIETKGLAIERSIASREEVLETMSAHMRGDLDEFLDEYGSFDLQKARANGKTKLLKELTIEEKILKGSENGPEILERKTKIKLVDTQKAADQLARHHKIYAEEGGGSEATTLGQLAKAMDAAARLTLYRMLLRGKAVDVETTRVG